MVELLHAKVAATQQPEAVDMLAVQGVDMSFL